MVPSALVAQAIEKKPYLVKIHIFHSFRREVKSLPSEAAKRFSLGDLLYFPDADGKRN
jgi:hypothetical protein